MNNNLILFLSIGLLLSSTANAENFHNARFAIINSTLSSSFTPQGRTGDVSAHLAFFPKLLQTQSTDTPQLFSTSPVTFELRKQEDLYLHFTQPTTRVNYTLSSIVRTFSVRPDLIEERYPLENLETELTPFLLPTRFINSEDPAIETIAAAFAKNATDAVTLSFVLAQWVKDNVEYNLSTLTADISQNASWVMKSKTGVCDELTVLFLALARAAGIPSRYVAGIAYTDAEAFPTNWIPHAWAEVYLPSIGWVPFDITYGQFGWVDAGHIITKTSGDVDDPSITYNWKTGDITLGPMELDGSTLSVTPINITPLSINLLPLINKVYPGSFVPIRVTVRNPTAYRLPTTLRVEKAPGLLGSPTTPLLLAPNSMQEHFLLIAVPDHIESTYDYSAPVVVSDSFGASATTSLEFGTAYPQFTKHRAREEIRHYHRSKSESSENMSIHCSTSKPFYQPEERGILVCSALAEQEREADVCFEETCKTLTLNNKPALAEFAFSATTTEEHNATVHSNKETSATFFTITVADRATLTITDTTCPRYLNTDEEGTITFTLTSDEPVQDVFVLVEGSEPTQVADFRGQQQIIVPIRGTQFVDKEGMALLYVTYSDVNGARYESFTTCEINVATTNPLDFLRQFWKQFLNLLHV